MDRPEVWVVRTGTANIASVVTGLNRAGAQPRIVENPRQVTQAERLVLPGVGAFGAAMKQLDEDRLVDVLAERVRDGRATLAVCLGMQLLAEASEENPGVAGLGSMEGAATRFPTSVRVPQLGWNRIEADQSCRWLRSGFAYFANSYRLERVPSGWCGGTADHGGPFVAAVEKGDVLACQFHPELSGPWGTDLLRRWLGTENDRGSDV